MKVLLTGASGFVGSHILDALQARSIPTVVLLRPTSDKRFLAAHLSKIELRLGSIADIDSLKSSMTEVTHVIHCAGCTKASQNSEFYDVNQFGTRNVVSAVNTSSGRLKRLLHVSSLAVTGPGTPDKPAREDAPLRPVSEYGRSKLAAETEVRTQSKVPFTIIRPPAVYGPRDNGFLPMFKAVQRHVRPQPSATQALSVVYGPDLAGAIVTCLDEPVAAGNTYFAACAEIVTARGMAEEIARQMGTWTVPLPLSPPVLWPVCLAQEIFSRLTGRAMLLNLQKFAELRAPGWVCDPARLTADTGYRCGTTLQQGVTQTLQWYSENRWL